MSKDRYAELTRILEERRREIMDQVQEKIRDVRLGEPRNSPTPGRARRGRRVPEADIPGRDRVRASFQMKAEDAPQNRRKRCGRPRGRHVRLTATSAATEISERRLRALPFAVRCKDCEEARETAQQRDRAIAQRRGAARCSSTCRGKPDGCPACLCGMPEAAFLRPFPRIITSAPLSRYNGCHRRIAE
jgi:RNA polymerase-binding transcription factor DksA